MTDPNAELSTQLYLISPLDVSGEFPQRLERDDSVPLLGGNDREAPLVGTDIDNQPRPARRLRREQHTKERFGAHARLEPP